MDGRDILRMPIGFYIEMIFRALLKSLCRIPSFWSTNNVDRSSCRYMVCTLAFKGSRNHDSWAHVCTIVVLVLSGSLAGPKWTDPTSKSTSDTAAAIENTDHYSDNY